MLTQGRLKQLISYDPDTGILLWMRKSCPKSRDDIIGTVAGTICSTTNRRTITIHRKSYLDYQLAFLYMEGYIPKEIDHEDNDTLNNR